MKMRAMAMALSAGATLLVSSSVEAQFRRPRTQPRTTTSRSGLNPIHEKTKNEAQSAYQRGDLQRTIDLVSSVLRANSRDDVAYYLRASARVDLGLQKKDVQTVRAGIVDAREAIRLKGRTNYIYYIPYFHGMTTLATLEDRPAHAQVVVTYATKTINQAGIKREDKSHLLYHRGRAHVALRKMDEAVADFKAAVQSLSGQIGFHLDLADALAKAGRTDEAVDAYKAAIARFPEDPIVYNNRGMFLQRQGKSPAAIADFTQAFQLNPKAFYALTNRGFALLKSGDASAAENDLTASLKLNPEQPRAYGLRASAKIAQGRIDEGISDHKESTRRDPKNSVAWANLGYACFFAGDYSGAVKSFDKAVELDSGRRYLHPWQHLSMAQAGQEDAAKSKFAKVVQADASKRDWIDHLLAYLGGQIDDETLIQSINDKPGVKTPQLCEAHFFIAEQHRLAGAADAANEHFRQAIETGAKQLAAYRAANFALKKVSTADGDN
jgi:tetratricopeptide (TPR) repeat protein